MLWNGVCFPYMANVNKIQYLVKYETKSLDIWYVALPYRLLPILIFKFLRCGLSSVAMAAAHKIFESLLIKTGWSEFNHILQKLFCRGKS